MSRIRSPAHPDAPLQKAVELASKLFERIRSNAVDRETAVREMGYSGMTGASGKMLANLIHFGLVSKAGKGSVKVTQLAVDIAHPKSADARRVALHQAGFSPAFFQSIRNEFSDGIPPETWLRSYMMREGFNSDAIGPAMSSYLDTCRYLQQESAFESHGAPPPPPIDSGEFDEPEEDGEMEAAPIERSSEKPAAKRVDRGTGPDERTVFTEEGAPGQYITLRVAGEVTDNMLEALEDYVKRQRKRLGHPAQ